MKHVAGLRTANVLVLLLGAFACGWFEKVAARAENLLSLDAFSVWVASPYFLLLIPVVLAHSKKGQVALLVVSLLMVAGALFIYYDTMFVHLDAQGGLVFLFLPLWQLLAVLGVIVTVVVARARARTAANPTIERDARNSSARPSS